MRSTRLHIVSRVGGGREGGVVTWSGGRGREVLSPGPGGEGGVVTWSRGERCCYLVLGGKGGVVTCSQGGEEVLSPGPGGRCCHLVPGREVLSPGPGGREVLSPGPGGEGDVMTFGVTHLPPWNRMSDTRLWKHNLRSLRYAGGKNWVTLKSVLSDYFGDRLLSTSIRIS